MFHLNKIKNSLIFSLFFLLILIPVNALEVVKPTKDFYVNDYANILSDETEKYIMDKSISLNQADGTQIVVVTIPSLNGNSLEDYSYQLFKEFKIGDKEKNNGLLLLLALDERKFRVEVGNGLEGILPDGKTGRFQDQYIIPYLKKDKWDEGIKNGYDAFFKEIVELNELDLIYEEPNKSKEDNEMWIMLISIIVGTVAGILIKRTKNSSPYTLIYLLLSIILAYINVALFFNLIAFIFARFGGVYSRGGYSGGGFSGGGFSGGGFSGGGGISSGGGSSRGF